MEFLTKASISNLRQRAALLQRTRAFFDSRGFFEVQTPVLSRDTIIDQHLDPIPVHMQLPGELDSVWFLQTSPEQSMKRLLASGIGSIYQIGPVFRGMEKGQYHNPEFTMLEWYDVGASHEDGLNFLDSLLIHLLGTSRATRIRFVDAVEQATGLDLFHCNVSQLAHWGERNKLSVDEGWSNDWDDWVNLIFSERVQPALGMDVPCIVTHFPSSQAALAQICESDPRTAERYEAFYRGVELANGYHELLDADQLMDRSVSANRMRVASGKSSLPVANRVIDAMRYGIPASCGCALGFDRLVMLACNAKSLEEVIAFTSDRA